MREPYPKELGLLYNKNIVISVVNYTLWSDFDLVKDFPGERELRMVAFSCAFPYGSSAEVPQSFGKTAPGVADAFRALEKNEFNSFFDTENKYSCTKRVFKKAFRAIVSKATFDSNMMIEEKTTRVCQQTVNSIAPTSMLALPIC